jgi:acetolactate synthase-1/2/3 large subunit
VSRNPGAAERLGACRNHDQRQGSINEEHPLAVGVGSNGGTPETRAIVDEADAIVFVGCRARQCTAAGLTAPGKAKVIHLDVIQPAGANYHVDVHWWATPNCAGAPERGARDKEAAARRSKGTKGKRAKVRQISCARAVRRQTNQTGTRGVGTIQITRCRCHRGSRCRTPCPYFGLITGRAALAPFF